MRLFPSNSEWREKGLAAVGLFLGKTIGREGYDWCTPKNCWVFGSTGGDGVHFSLLERQGAVEDNSPVVVTQPANMGQSCIVGENLYDFLCFGMNRGFRPFETIGPEWNPKTSWRKLSTPDEEEQQILNFLIKRFELKPWATAKRFRLLQKAYLEDFDYPPEMRQ